MFSRITRSFKGSQDTLMSDTAKENHSYHHVSDLLQDFDSRSQVSTSKSEAVHQEGNHRIKKKSRSRKLSKLMFGSDLEEDVNSVVSDNPQLYNRSMSLHTLASNVENKTNMLQNKQLNTTGRKKFDHVEYNMENIQKSLSISELTEPMRPFPTSSVIQNATKSDLELVQKLRKEIQRKEKSITQLKKQLNQPEEESQTSKLETKITLLESQLEAKTKLLKKKQAAIQLTNIDRSIDRKINLAEMEYEIEKYKLDNLNLTQTINSMKASGEQQKASIILTKEETLYRHVHRSDTTSLITKDLSSAHLEFVDIRPEGIGLEWNDESTLPTLKVGDRLLEVNGEMVIKITPDVWSAMKKQLKKNRELCQGVFLRLKTSSPTGETTGPETKQDMIYLKDDIQLIQNRLERKLAEGRNVSTELQLVQKERDALSKENTRLSHRIAFLEEHTKELQGGLTAVRDSLTRTLDTEIQDTLTKLDMFTMDSMTDTERCSTATSGIYSAAGSEGSNSPESFSSNNQSRQRPDRQSNLEDATKKRWSLGLPEAPNSKVTQSSSMGPQQETELTISSRRHIGQTSNIPPPKPVRQYLNQSVVNLSSLGHSMRSTQDQELDKFVNKKKSAKVTRSSSKVSSVSNLVRWPLKQSKEKSTSSAYDSKTGKTENHVLV